MRRWLTAALSALLALGCSVALPALEAAAAHDTTITNFTPAGAQTARFDTKGNAIDAHDGEIVEFGGAYYLYGTSYDCGFAWQDTNAPFCGFKSYSSTDLVHWTDRGFLYGAANPTWQQRCNGATYGCFRPHVAYNAASGRYVLWVNVYDNAVGYRVFTGTSPTGPFTEVAQPTLAVNNNAPVGGVNNGDHDLFVDDNGTGYLAYTDWRANGEIVVERLDAAYLSGSGSYVRLGKARTEAPAMFKRGNLYYLTFSDPNCGYCTTGTSYQSASSPLGPWSAVRSLTTTSCAGQPSFVTPIATPGGTAYLYGSDLWNNSARNEALANYYWAPLSFDANGALQPITCPPSTSLTLANGSPGHQQFSPELDQSSGVNGFRTYCDIGGTITRMQTFVPSRGGKLTSASYTTFQNGKPNAGLAVKIFRIDGASTPSGPALYSTTVPTSSIGWSPRDVTVYPSIDVTAGARYGIQLSSSTTSGCYGMTYNDSFPYAAGNALYSNNSGTSFAVEANRSNKFTTTVSSRVQLPANAVPAGYTRCADDWGLCAPNRSTVIAYGAAGGFVYQTVPAGVTPCTPSAFGQDPAYGSAKSCYVAHQNGPSGYTACAEESTGNCTFSGTREVAYGRNGSFAYRTATGGISCDNNTFGGDPFYLVLKACYVKD